MGKGVEVLLEMEMEMVGVLVREEEEEEEEKKKKEEGIRMDLEMVQDLGTLVDHLETKELGRPPKSQTRTAAPRPTPPSTTPPMSQLPTPIPPSTTPALPSTTPPVRPPTTTTPARPSTTPPRPPGTTPGGRPTSGTPPNPSTTLTVSSGTTITLPAPSQETPTASSSIPQSKTSTAGPPAMPSGSSSSGVESRTATGPTGTPTGVPNPTTGTSPTPSGGGGGGGSSTNSPGGSSGTLSGTARPTPTNPNLPFPSAGGGTRGAPSSGGTTNTPPSPSSTNTTTDPLSPLPTSTSPPTPQQQQSSTGVQPTPLLITALSLISALAVGAFLGVLVMTRKTIHKHRIESRIQRGSSNRRSSSGETQGLLGFYKSIKTRNSTNSTTNRFQSRQINAFFSPSTPPTTTTTMHFQPHRRPSAGWGTLRSQHSDHRNSTEVIRDEAGVTGLLNSSTHKNTLLNGRFNIPPTTSSSSSPPKSILKNNAPPPVLGLPPPVEFRDSMVSEASNNTTEAPYTLPRGTTLVSSGTNTPSTKKAMGVERQQEQEQVGGSVQTIAPYMDAAQEPFNDDYEDEGYGNGNNGMEDDDDDDGLSYEPSVRSEDGGDGRGGSPYVLVDLE
ncbi:hypothetical protein HDV05_005426 [Chytridiales sp. JEL 0842]|nr:hypothetical protein HDV05_005426 [Chytridiales sp. JEL 0842]